MNIIGVRGKRGLVKDLESNAVININNSEIERARALKEQNFLKRKEEQELKESVASLENEVSEIKSILNQLLEKL